MTQPNPFATVTDQPADDRDYIPMARCKGKLMVVRPLEYQREGFTTVHKPEGQDVVFCDIAVLDPIPEWEDEEGNSHAGFPAGQQFRNQAVLQGYLKGTFKRYIGSTLIGTMYRGTPTKGKPPMMWQDLSTDTQCVQRGQRFLAARPEFLIPVEAAITPTEPEPTGFQGYQPPPGYYPTTGLSAAPEGAPYAQPDPWSQAPVSATPVSPAQRPQTTLEQLRSMGQVNHQNQVQSSDPPF